MDDPETSSIYDEMLQEFVLKSKFTYIVSACFIVIIHFTVVYLFLTRKFLRGKAKNIVLFSLSLSDLAYEAITTPLFLQCDSRAAPLSVKCETLYFTYLMFNISTVLHVLFGITETITDAYCTILNHRSLITPYASLSFSVCAWSGSLFAGYICTWSEDAFLDERAMVLLGRFKAIGYFFFAISSFAVPVLFVPILSVGKRCGKSEESKMIQQNKVKQTIPLRPMLRSDQKDELVFCCIYLAYLVGWLAWLTLGVDTRIMRSAEIMKYFEITRLYGRIFNPLLYTFMKRDFRFALTGISENDGQGNHLVSEEDI